MSDEKKLVIEVRKLEQLEATGKVPLALDPLADPSDAVGRAPGVCVDDA